MLSAFTAQVLDLLTPIGGRLGRAQGLIDQAATPAALGLMGVIA